MYREIRKKKLILATRKPFSSAVSAQLQEINLIDMIYSTIRLSGSGLTRENIRTILHGNVIREATIQEHALIENYSRLQREMESLTEMGTLLTSRTLAQLYRLISGRSELSFRTTNPIVRELSYNPPHFKEVPEQMQILMAWASKDNDGETGNELLKAAYFHNRLVEVYPFEEQNRELARIGLYYYMMSKGYPPFTFNFSKQEYNEAIAGYIKNDDVSAFYSGLERSLYNKLDFMMQLTAVEELD